MPRAHNRVRTLKLQLLLMSGGVEDQRKRAKRSRACSDSEEDVVESPGVTPVIHVDSPVATPAEEKTPDDTPVVDAEMVPPIPLAGALKVTQYEMDDEDLDEDSSTVEENMHEIPGAFLSNNTPSKSSAPGKIVKTMGVWKYIKRIRNLHAALLGAGYSTAFADKQCAIEKGKMTHVCMKCWRLLHMSYDTKELRWSTSLGIKHTREFHPETDEGSKAKDREQDAENARAEAMWEHGVNMESGSKSVNTPDKALSSQARWYAYSRQHVSKAAFDDPAFREMLQSMFTFGGGKGDAPVLSRTGLKKWLRGEYNNFLIYSKFMFAMLREYHEGNAFAQAIHDAATLADHHKRLAAGATFVTPGLLHLPSVLKVKVLAPGLLVPPMQPFAICLSMVPLADGRDTTAAEVRARIVTRFGTVV